MIFKNFKCVCLHTEHSCNNKHRAINFVLVCEENEFEFERG